MREPAGGQAGGRPWQGSVWEEGHWREGRKEGDPVGRKGQGLELHLLWPCGERGGPLIPHRLLPPSESSSFKNQKKPNPTQAKPKMRVWSTCDVLGLFSYPALWG